MKKSMLLMLLVIGTDAFAQVEKGDKNISFNALHIGGEGVGLGVVNAKVGFYLTDKLEMGVTPTLSFVTFEEETETTPGIGAYASYNFLTSNGILLPYLGTSVDYFKSQGVIYILGGVFGGIKFFVSENVNVDVGGKLMMVEDYKILMSTIGIGFIIGKSN